MAVPASIASICSARHSARAALANVGAFGDIDHVLVDGVDLVSSEVL
jgi:hypothetical protein